MSQVNSKSTIPEMLGKLDELYKREEDTENRIRALFIALDNTKDDVVHQTITKHIKTLLILYEQLQEDIELGEQLVMYASNRKARGGHNRTMGNTGYIKK
jgi:hypothetical protein